MPDVTITAAKLAELAKLADWQLREAGFDPASVTDAVLRAEEHKRKMVVLEKPKPLAFFWTGDPDTNIWYTQAEPDYPDGRYSIVPNTDGTGTVNLYGYDRPEPILAGVSLDHAKRAVGSL